MSEGVDGAARKHGRRLLGSMSSLGGDCLALSGTCSFRSEVLDDLLF